MGAMKRLGEAKVDARRSKSAAGKSGGGLLGKLRHADSAVTGGAASWEGVTPDLLGWLVDRATRDGGAIMFGTTRDGGALTIRLYEGEEKPHTEYFPAQGDVSMAIWSFCLKLSDEGEEPEAPQ